MRYLKYNLSFRRMRSFQLITYYIKPLLSKKDYLITRLHKQVARHIRSLLIVRKGMSSTLFHDTS